MSDERATGQTMRRMDGFAAEINDLDGYEATAHDREVAVTIIADEAAYQIDLTPVFRAARRYELAAFDGHTGSNVVQLHFRPQEEDR